MGTHYKGTAAERRALDAYIKLSRCTDSVQARLERALEAAGVSEGQFGTLEALLHLGPLSPGELRRKMFRSGGNVTMVLDNLERRGLVERQRNENDRRCFIVRLTPDGRRLIKKLFRPHVAWILEAFSTLPVAEQEQLAALCKKLGLAVAALSAEPAESRA